MIAYCAIPGSETAFYANIYIYDTDRLQFVLQEEAAPDAPDPLTVLKKYENPRNITFDCNG